MRAATEAAAGRGRVAGRALSRRGDGRPVGLIGPNAVTRMAQALEAGEGHSICLAVFADAGIARYLAEPPTRMLDEQEVARLHRALIDRLGPDRGGDISWEAGRLTGDYLLANRIPRLVQILLRRLPRPLAARLLIRAIARNAWTFCGSGQFSWSAGPRLTMRLRGSPVCRLLRTQEPACHYFAGTFARLFAALLGPGVRVVETECEATGVAACRFEVTW
jgi:divinyl protochlorophyllide a 8-vinyl-reductase